MINKNRIKTLNDMIIEISLDFGTFLKEKYKTNTDIKKNITIRL